MVWLCLCREITEEQGRHMTTEEFISDIECAVCIDRYLEIKE